MKKSRKRIGTKGVLCLLLAILLSLTGCSQAGSVGGGKAKNLMAGISARTVKTDVDLNGAGAGAVTDFGLRLLTHCLETEGQDNPMISPFSILSALTMTANGARGETLAQMESAFGMSIEDLRQYLAAYAASLPEGEKYGLNSANSLWVRDGAMELEPEFLQLNADYFGADVFEAPFDESTRKEINGWVEKNTDGTIPEILGEISENAVMYLVNALVFEAEWEVMYEKNQVERDDFTREDGTTEKADLMYSTEYAYLENETATGFLKNYAEGKYAFAALLPKEGVSVADCVSSFTGEQLHSLLTGYENTEVDVAIPKFESKYGVELSDALQAMGITSAFGGSADFSGMGSASDGGELYIEGVNHKTYISVTERDTRAGAATTVEVDTKSAEPMEEPKRVILDRPFLYAIIDCEASVPVFLGTVNGIAQ